MLILKKRKVKKRKAKSDMKNFIVRTITAVFFVAAIVTCFLRAEAMVLLFSLVTGLTIWEFTGLVNDRENITVNRMICTVAGVYFFLAMAGYCSGITPSGVFIPYRHSPRPLTFLPSMSQAE